jgi:hypothetical protein
MLPCGSVRQPYSNSVITVATIDCSKIPAQYRHTDLRKNLVPAEIGDAEKE